jgi:hypothetical protein
MMPSSSGESLSVSPDRFSIDEIRSEMMGMERAFESNVEPVQTHSRGILYDFFGVYRLSCYLDVGFPDTLDVEII